MRGASTSLDTPFVSTASAESRAPAPAAERLAAIDALRGFALAGVLLANLPLFAGEAYMSDAQRSALPTAGADAVVGFLMRLLVENKFMGLFAVLFGLGFSLQLARASARGASGLPIYWRRLGWLLAIGAVHGWLVWCWEILRFYALWGMLLPLFRRCRQRTLLALGIALGAVVPGIWYGAVGALDRSQVLPVAPVDAIDARAFAAFSGGDYGEVLHANLAYDWHLTLSPTQGAYQIGVFGRMLLGLWLGRLLLAGGGAVTPLVSRRVVGGCLGVGLLGSAIFAAMPTLRGSASWFAVPVRLGTLALTGFYLTAVLIALQHPLGQRLQQPLSAVGRMSLTNYLLQTLLGLWLFYGFLPGPHLMGKVGLALLLPIWAVIYASQVAFSWLWLRRFRFGPCEWLWRSLTYGRWQPFRLAPTAALAPSAAAARVSAGP